MAFSKEVKTLINLAISELPKLSKKNMIKQIHMIHNLDCTNFKKWYWPGIRSQVVDIKTCRMVEDFITEYDGFSMHVLNCVSPGWTCSMPFSEHIVDEISSKFKLL